MLQVGADDDGYAVRLKLKHFLGYLEDPNHMQDDSPMYIFDGTFGDRDGSKKLCGDYSIPGWFSEDLMQLVGDRRRPPYRSARLPLQMCFSLFVLFRICRILTTVLWISVSSLPLQPWCC